MTYLSIAGYALTGRRFGAGLVFVPFSITSFFFTFLQIYS